MANYKCLHFQCPDPTSKEAVSCTTRYRLRKKRKATKDNESILVEGKYDVTGPLEHRGKIEDSIEVYLDTFEEPAADASLISQTLRKVFIGQHLVIATQIMMKRIV